MSEQTEQTERPRFYTVAEVAEILRISKMTAYRLAKQGRIPCVMVGSTYRIPIESFEKWITNQSTGSNHPTGEQ